MSIPNASLHGLARCPDCASTMAVEDWEGVQIDCCARCRGFWFDGSELDRYLAARGLPPLEGGIPARGVGTRLCPRCQKSLSTAGWTGIVLDRCNRCRGLFVEFHELPRLENGQGTVQAVAFEQRLQVLFHEAGWNLLTAKGLVLILLRLLRLL